MSNITGDGGSFSSENHTGEEVQQQLPLHGTIAATTNGDGSNLQPPPLAVKKKRNLPGTPDPTAEVIALSPTTLLATNRFVCEICNKGFQRDQNLQLHRRGHNLPWKLRQRTSTEVRKRVYICPETTCVHHNPSRALGDLTGIKKHFCRKHGEKKWKCDKCLKKYAVLSDWKAHTKICGTREYKCDCGTAFSRKDSFITHRAFCDALIEENNKAKTSVMPTMSPNLQAQLPELMMPMGTNTTNLPVRVSDFDNHEIKNPLKGLAYDLMPTSLRSHNTMAGTTMLSSTSATTLFSSGSFHSSCNGLDGGTKTGQPAIGSAHISATALLQKAAQMGATATSGSAGATQRCFVSLMAGPDRNWVQQHGMGANGGAFGNQFFDIGMGGSSAVIDAGVLNSTAGVFVGGGDRGHGFVKGLEHETGGGLMQGGSGRSGLRYGGGSRDVTTLDFLGVSRARSVAAMGLHEQQQGMEFGGVGQKRLHGLHPFQQQHQLSHSRAATMEKVVWDV
ncbi:protein indeterminate-domain 7-like [Elaeis guineensis]|uniref:Protein EARLY HEADING DATE 2 n=1 Tax=Elaeis guineensis var. tenera TaxID=51953 RepID=A0A6I9Q8I3_ELAGV|nr:zinc finger protein GAI-ASSOCIATED FACTOR 1-like [Elaeis guineensis]